MKLAIISDIHGNLEALQEVLADVEQFEIDFIISLGDNIGYGPDSEQVVALLQRRGIPSIMGNHELALLDPSYLSWFNPLARTSLVHARRSLSDTSLLFISELPATLIERGCRFVHGFPPDSITTYLFEASQLRLQNAFALIPERLCFVGHTHKLELIGFDGSTITRARLRQGPMRLDRAKRYIINAGSVGQPRDGNNQAKYVVWDEETDCLEVRYVAYDYVSVAIKIVTAGLPKAHAERLY